jgi:hypothetical protein
MQSRLRKPLKMLSDAAIRKNCVPGLQEAEGSGVTQDTADVARQQRGFVR